MTQLDGSATAALLSGVAVKTVASNPPTAYAAALAAMNANGGRAQGTTLQTGAAAVAAWVLVAGAVAQRPELRRHPLVLRARLVGYAAAGAGR